MDFTSILHVFDVLDVVFSYILGQIFTMFVEVSNSKASHFLRATHQLPIYFAFTNGDLVRRRPKKGAFKLENGRHDTLGRGQGGEGVDGLRGGDGFNESHSTGRVDVFPMPDGKLVRHFVHNKLEIHSTEMVHGEGES